MESSADVLALVVIMIVAAASSAGIWWGVTHLLMRISGLKQEVNLINLGRLVESYGTGSGVIGGVRFGGCLVINRHEHGYVFSVWKIFGGGKLALRDDEILSVEETSVTLFGSRVKITTRGSKPILLTGQLSKSFQAKRSV